MVIKETHVNATEKINLGDSDWYEPFTSSKGEMFKALQKEYGRCVSKVYMNNGIPVGWIFQGKCKYSDTGEEYIREVWVELKGCAKHSDCLEVDAKVIHGG